MAATLHLLSLPQEIRDHIWAFAFADLNITPWTCSNVAVEICEKCHIEYPKDIVTYRTAVEPLFTCRQIYNEALPLFRSTMNLHITNETDLQAISASLETPQNASGTDSPHSREHQKLHISSFVRNLTLAVHLDEESREDWYVELRRIPAIFASLTHLTIRNHMRAPTSYSSLSDGMFFAGSVVLLNDYCSEKTSSGSPRVALSVSYGYPKYVYIFEHPYLGAISNYDAFDAHVSVLQTLIEDEDFKKAARIQKWIDDPLEEDGGIPGMATRLFAVAREHEGRWLESLAAKREQEREAEREAERQYQGEGSTSSTS